MDDEGRGLQAEMLELARSGALLRRAAELGAEYAAGVGDQRVCPAEEALRGLDSFDEELPEAPLDGRELLDRLHRDGSPGTVAATGGRYFGFVNGGALPASLGARLLADVWDQNAVLHVSSPINARLEEVVEGWLKQVFGLPEECVAGYVSGTSMATFCGLAAARQHLLARAGWSVRERGLRGAPALRVITSRQAHGTVTKALALLGLGTEAIEGVDVDDQGRLELDALPALDERCLVVVQAGNVNSGSFDPIAAVVERARAAGAWVHVDGAFGLWAAACERLRGLVDGIAGADSWSADAHKTLNAPYDCGVVLCRHPEVLVEALQNSGEYIVFSEERDGMLYTTDMSRRARAVDVWAALRSLGRRGLDDLVWRLHRRAVQFAEELAAAGFEVLNQPVFNQVLVAGESDAQTAAMMLHVQRSGEAWFGGSSWFGRAVIRLSVCSWATTEEDVSRTVRALVTARDGGALRDA